jgi:hypothetical protein
MRVLARRAQATRVWNRAATVELSVILYEQFHREWLAMPGVDGMYV